MKLIYKYQLWILMFMGIMLQTRSQTSDVLRGQVIDENGLALPGAAVQIKGTSQGVFTDDKGAYALPIARKLPVVVTFSFTGYERAEVQVYEIEEEPLVVQLKSRFTLKEVVVTGSSSKYTKFESSVSISTLNAKQLDMRVPRSTGDALKIVPGLAVNNTQGEIGNGIVARGLPPGGPGINSFIFLGMHEDGMPVYEIPNGPVGLDYHFRLDETIEKIEAVRGGSASIFASNNPGGIINFISKTGGNRIEGIFKTTIGTQPSYRADFNVGGPLSENWKFNLGGFYRYDYGVKDPGWPANVGGQIKANITREFEGGYFRIYGRVMRDRNTLFSSIPYINLLDPQPIEGGPGFRYGSFSSEELAYLRQPDPIRTGTRTITSPRDGVRSNYKNIAMDIYKELGNGWELRNLAKAIFTTYEINNLGPGNTPFKASTVPGNLFIYVNTRDTIRNVSQINGNGLLIRQTLGHTSHDWSNFINNTLISKKVGKHKVQFGPYLSQVNQIDTRFDSDLLTDVSERPKLVNWVVIDTATRAVKQIQTDNGFLQYSTPGQGKINNTNQNYVIAALYIGDEWRPSERLRLEGGVRFEQTLARGSSERPTNINLDGNSITVYDNRFTTGSGRYRYWNYRYLNVNFSIGANYTLSEHLASYLRATRGARTPTPHNHFNLVENGTAEGNGQTLKAPPDEMYQAEAGLKFNYPRFSLFSTFYYTTIRIRQNVNTVLQPGNFLDNFIQFARSYSYGLELEAVYRPVDALEVKLVGTFQDARYGNFKIPVRALVPAELPPLGVPTTVAEIDITGNRVQQTPPVIADAQVSYFFKQISLFANYRYTSGYYLNRRNTVSVDGWGELNGGASLDIGQLTITVKGSNLLNTVALQNGNAPGMENIESVSEEGFAQYDFNPNSTTQIAPNPYGFGQFILPRVILTSVAIRF